MNGYAVTEDAIRIIIKDGAELSNFYIYAFLKSKIGKSSLLSGSYGSVIQHLNEEYIGNIKIPVLDLDIRNKINYCVQMHIKKLNDAIVKENQAIDLIEKEIESWQKS
jgi:type I restriction enzyme S subunit